MSEFWVTVFVFLALATGIKFWYRLHLTRRAAFDRPVRVPSCSHLGLTEDPFNRRAAPSEEHRCYLRMGRERVDLSHQKSFCLSGEHRRCPWLTIGEVSRVEALRRGARATAAGWGNALGVTSAAFVSWWKRRFQRAAAGGDRPARPSPVAALGRRLAGPVTAPFRLAGRGLVAIGKGMVIAVAAVVGGTLSAIDQAAHAARSVAGGAVLGGRTTASAFKRAVVFTGRLSVLLTAGFGRLLFRVATGIVNGTVWLARHAAHALRTLAVSGAAFTRAQLSRQLELRRARAAAAAVRRQEHAAAVAAQRQAEANARRYREEEQRRAAEAKRLAEAAALEARQQAAGALSTAGPDVLAAAGPATQPAASVGVEPPMVAAEPVRAAAPPAPAAVPVQPSVNAPQVVREPLAAAATHAPAATDGLAGLAQDVADLVRQARAATAAGDKRLAYRLTVEACEVAPEAAEAWLWRGATSSDPVEQRQSLRKALQIDPDIAMAAALLEELDESFARPKAAPQPAAVSFTPSASSGVADLIRHGLAALDRRDDDLAYRCFSLVTELEPENAQAWFLRAKTAQDLDEVIRCLEQVRALDPANAQVKQQLAWARRRQAREVMATRYGQPARDGDTPRSMPKARPPRGGRRLDLAPAFGAFGRFVGTVASVVIALGWLWIGLLALVTLGGEEHRVLPAQLAGALDRLAQPEIARWLPNVSLPSLVLTDLLPDGPAALTGFDVGLTLPAVLAFAFLLLAGAIRHGDRGVGLWAAALGAGHAAYGLYFGITPETSAVALFAALLLTVGGLLAPAGLRPPLREGVFK